MQQNFASCGRNVICLWFEISPSQDRKYVSKLEFSTMNISQRGPHSCIGSGWTALRSKNARCGNAKKSKNILSVIHNNARFYCWFSVFIVKGFGSFFEAITFGECARTLPTESHEKCFFISVSVSRTLIDPSFS